MKERTLFPGAGAACLLAVSLAAGADQPAPARVYTEEDLARESPRRGETGVESQPAVPPPAESKRAAGTAAGRGEPYWRAEAARVRDRVEPWRDTAAELRLEISARQAEPGVRPYTDPKVRALQRRLATLEARIRAAEDRLEERARRAGAMPGWLR
jgi:hypothetical protein